MTDEKTTLRCARQWVRMVTDGNTMVATRMMADAKSMATMMVGDNIIGTDPHGFGWQTHGDEGGNTMITMPMHVQTMLAIRKTDVTMQPIPVTQATPADHGDG